MHDYINIQINKQMNKYINNIKCMINNKWVNKYMDK